MKSKICSKCKIEKDLSEFYTSKKEKDGKQYTCISCQKIYREENKEKYKKYSKNYRERKKAKKIMKTMKDRLFEIIKEKNSITQKELLEKFENKKELFRDLQELTDNRKIGQVASIDGNNPGESYYIK